MVLTLALSSSVHAAPAPPAGAGKGLERVAEVEYGRGMHLVVTRSGGRDYVFASAAEIGVDGAGIRVFDVTNPARPKKVAAIPCAGNQAFLQIANDGRTLVVGEGAPHGVDSCMPAGETGFYTIDVSNPRKPKPLGYAVVSRTGHTVTAHPKKPVVYVSHGDYVPRGLPAFEVWSIANPKKPKLLRTGTVTGVHSPHDFAFNRDGTRAVAASMSAIQVLDTSNPVNPKELEVLQCPGCTHNHEAHFTPDQKHVVVSDEASGGAAAPCPLGALYFYEWNADGSPYLNLIGQWQPAELVTPQGAPTNAGLCTSHVFGISPDGKKIAASWHTAGVRVVDITDMSGVGVGEEGDGAKELGWYVAEGADSWSAKFDRSGRFVFVNDANTGFQVYRLPADRS